MGIGVVLAPVGWFGTDYVEQDNDFCISCHLSADVPLHRHNHADFGGEELVSLAVAHARAGNEEREDGAFRCIDCHGGVGFLGKARVKALSAKDALVYLTGSFDEPEGMHWPLLDADCSQCHESFPEPVLESWETPPFHALPVHNQALGVGCVECHTSHEPTSAEIGFLQPTEVRAQCARCHSEFEESLP